MSGTGSPTRPSRKRPRTEELADADPTKPAEAPDWTPCALDEGEVSEVLEGETAQGKSQTEDEFEDDDMHMDEGGLEDRVRARDEDFWFEDGTVVLVAEGVEFRVYEGLLADHSPVLRDMFMFSGEDDGDDEHDGGSRDGAGEDVGANSNAASNVDVDATSDAVLQER